MPSCLGIRFSTAQKMTTTERAKVNIDIYTILPDLRNVGRNGCLPLFFFGFCERSQILSGVAKSRIWRAFLSFCVLILFEPFLATFWYFGFHVCKMVFCPHPKMVNGGSAVAERRRRKVRWQRSGSAAAVAWLGQQWWWQQRRWWRWRKRQRRRVGN